MFSPVLHVAVALQCWLWKLGIVRSALRVTIVGIQWNLVIAGRQEKTRPVVTVQVCTPNSSTMVSILCSGQTR